MLPKQLFYFTFILFQRVGTSEENLKNAKKDNLLHI